MGTWDFVSGSTPSEAVNNSGASADTVQRPLNGEVFGVNPNSGWAYVEDDTGGIYLIMRSLVGADSFSQLSKGQRIAFEHNQFSCVSSFNALRQSLKAM